MTMDYFLLLCSLLLPVVSTVEGKKSPFQPLFAMPGVFPPRHVSTLPGQKLGAAGGEAPNHPSYLFFLLSSTIKIPLF